MRKLMKTGKLTTFQIIIFSFLAVILLGSLLLMTPWSSADGTWTPFADSCFTATSAVCVTGLVVRDTARSWSGFGQMVILTLIQIGGMGVVTVALLISIVSGRKIGLMQRQTMQDAISAPQVGGIVRLTGFIFRIVCIMELVGFLILFPVFKMQFGTLKALWYALFHSISAFCNAGFDLMGKNAPFSSLTAYSGNIIVNGMIMFLIVAGGIGFLTWEDICKHRFHVTRYRMQSKVILSATGLLILVPMLIFYFTEFGALPAKDRILASFFQSVTARTAGFNTVDLDGLHDTGKILLIVLMLIGGSPGSTAGGMKTTTIAMVLLCAVSVFRRQENVHCFKRRIAQETIRNAAAIFLMYIVLFLSSACVISYLEGIPILTCMFETASAIGTVGLTLGITTQLGQVSRIILILLMFWGRVGGLTLIYAAVSDGIKKGKHYPQEKITVG